MKKHSLEMLGILSGIVIVLGITAFFGFKIGAEEDRLNAIAELVSAQKFAGVFNSAQELVYGSFRKQVKAKAYYYQAYALYKQGKKDFAEMKLKKMWELDEEFDHLSENDDFNDFYVDVKEDIISEIRQAKKKELLGARAL
ncbi:MAG: hypothetical protein KKH94_08265 [Candidatus Omnitrophica bacterium]|nr:hypothetical protein [Candidatus Omnitrophota bacterium]